MPFLKVQRNAAEWQSESMGEKLQLDSADQMELYMKLHFTGFIRHEFGNYTCLQMHNEPATCFWPWQIYSPSTDLGT